MSEGSLESKVENGLIRPFVSSTPRTLQPAILEVRGCKIQHG
jgi:hypothetical protein